MPIPIVGELLGKAIDVGDRILGRFVEDKDKRTEAQVEFRRILSAERGEFEATLRQELASKERIIVAELQQADNYTKRARPTILYTGVVLVVLEVVARYASWFLGYPFPIQDGQLITTFVPAEFWWAWGGISGTYVLGRTAEKRARMNGNGAGKLTKLITGNG